MEEIEVAPPKKGEVRVKVIANALVRHHFNGATATNVPEPTFNPRKASNATCDTMTTGHAPGGGGHRPTALVFPRLASARSRAYAPVRTTDEQRTKSSNSLTPFLQSERGQFEIAAQSRPAHKCPEAKLRSRAYRTRCKYKKAPARDLLSSVQERLPARRKERVVS